MLAKLASPMVRTFCLLVVALALSCGAASPTLKTPKASAAGSDISVGDTAVAQGGIPALASGDQGVSETAPGALRAERVAKDTPVKLDGTLQEWPGRSPATVVVKGAAGERLAFAIAVQYDDKFLYVGGEVRDDSFFRTQHFGEGEDHASLIIAFPNAGSFSAYEVGLFAGKPGESAGEVRLLSGARHGEALGSKIVEAPTANGYTFEAALPWSIFPEARLVRVGLRGSARYFDSDGSASARNIIATSAGDTANPAALPPLLTEPEQALLEGLLEPRGIANQAPKADIYADVAGDAMKERIAVFDRYFTICGSGYRGGKEFFVRDIGAELVRLDARELTGRGKADLVLRRRFSSDGATREWFEIWSLMGGDEPVTTFSHEIAVSREGKHVDNAVHVSGRDIEVTVEPSTTWDRANYREPTVGDVDPILLPWGPIRSQSFHFNGSRFAKQKETKQAPAAVGSGSGARSGSDTAEQAAPSFKPEEPASPAVQQGGDLAKQVFEQYKRDRGVAADAKPKADLEVQVDGDARPERVILVGRDIVVVGPGFKGGTQYAIVTLQQFADPADIHDMTARDLTGDGAADLIVRGVRHVTAGTKGDALDVEATFIYQLKNEAIARIFGIETAREQGSKRVVGLVQFVPGKDKGFDIDARPGRAVGWTEKTYPWAQDQPGSGSVEPLLLPWGKIQDVRYVFNGTQYAQK
jgi:hypothetical protein